MDSSLHLVPGHYKPPTAPGGSLRKDSPGWEKAENKFTATSGLRVCVCVLCRLHICTCVFQCVVCAIKNLTKVLIIIGRNAELCPDFYSSYMLNYMTNLYIETFLRSYQV